MMRWHAVATLMRGVLDTPEELPVEGAVLADQRKAMDEAADDVCAYAGTIAARALEIERGKQSWWRQA